MSTALILLRGRSRDSRWGWKDLIALRNEWRHRLRSRRELAALNDRELRDIGVTRNEARGEIDKPFWRA